MSNETCVVSFVSFLSFPVSKSECGFIAIATNGIGLVIGGSLLATTGAGASLWKGVKDKNSHWIHAGFFLGFVGVLLGEEGELSENDANDIINYRKDLAASVLDGIYSKEQAGEILNDLDSKYAHREPTLFQYHDIQKMTEEELARLVIKDTGLLPITVSYLLVPYGIHVDYRSL